MTKYKPYLVNIDGEGRVFSPRSFLDFMGEEGPFDMSRTYMKEPYAAQSHYCPMGIKAFEQDAGYCKGERCMAWRWKSRKSEMFEDGDPKIPADWVKAEDIPSWVTKNDEGVVTTYHYWQEPNDPNLGYCGMVGG